MNINIWRTAFIISFYFAINIAARESATLLLTFKSEEKPQNQANGKCSADIFAKYTVNLRIIRVIYLRSQGARPKSARRNTLQFVPQCLPGKKT